MLHIQVFRTYSSEEEALKKANAVNKSVTLAAVGRVLTPEYVEENSHLMLSASPCTVRFYGAQKSIESEEFKRITS